MIGAESWYWNKSDRAANSRRCWAVSRSTVQYCAELQSLCSHM